jgi:hypothetical protein
MNLSKLPTYAIVSNTGGFVGMMAAVLAVVPERYQQIAFVAVTFVAAAVKVGQGVVLWWNEVAPKDKRVSRRRTKE